MTTGMPELGSKISLISKADIRYEGRLFTVDPQECTIALASVRSFGTEDRETQYPVPAQSQVYDYILFRGSDIKDIRVVNNVSHPQPLNDPAIMQLSIPPSLGTQQFQQHPVLGHVGAPIGQFGNSYTMGSMGGLGAAGLRTSGSASTSGSKPSELIIMPQGGPPEVVAPPLVLSQPIMEPFRSNEHQGSVLDLITGAAAGSRSTTPASVGSRKSLSVDQGIQAGGSQQKESGKRHVKPIQPPKGGQGHGRPRDRRDSDNQNQAAHSSSNRGGSLNRSNYHQMHQQNNQAYQRGWSVHRGPQRSRGRSRTLKFENDFDFEQANTEFEELRSKFAKAKLEDASVSNKSSELNGIVAETDKKDDSGNETGAGENEPEDDHEVYYDASKSFFDKISCEAVERAKGKCQRMNWRTERKLNSETFGVASTRRGNYRGRGNFRGGYRGYRGGYRHPQQRRDNNQQQNEVSERQ
ncbi:LOW QUALITY PROTEIN: protein LSM14 homolog B-A [Cylas formicarius]|uniref:LOW QUALITY PROTEIN: protein LSM14 homolog B-A n=1 Tax=Cylas formicarius TaxID=197179 RepID=UPI002958A5E4|nr:LOW QUALITY PROTEIN: protein LSM14 homolog B-A [Cylas formicarius]